MKESLSITVILIIFLSSTQIFAQVKIGDNPKTVDPSSLLELESTNKGLLLPRLADTTSISNPPQGMFLFNNTDTSLYFRRKGGWKRLSIGDDNYWKGISFDLGTPVYQILSDLPAVVNITGKSPVSNRAPFQTRGMIGSTLSMFGEGLDNTQGVSLVGNIPGIYFNSYYDKNPVSMAPGNTGNLSFDQSINSGGAYYFNFTGYSSTANTNMTNSTAEMILNYDGRLGIHTGSVPIRSYVEQHGEIHNNSAIFGGEGSGVAIEEHWPAIGFNSYFNGSGQSSIGAGYAGEIGIDQTNGDFYVTTMNAKALNANKPFTEGFKRYFNISPGGFVGINTLAPLSELEIDNLDNTLDVSNGLTLLNKYFTTIGSFNISTHVVLDPDLIEYVPALVFQSGKDGIYADVANIDNQGNYHQTSDARFKKDIASLDKDDMLQKLLLLKPSNYRFINEKENYPKSYGFIAQDVEKIFPEFVNTIQGKKMLAYSSFIPVIVSAMQEQQKEIESLKNQRLQPSSVQKENEDLKYQVMQLTQTVKQLQQKVDALQKQVK